MPSPWASAVQRSFCFCCAAVWAAAGFRPGLQLLWRKRVTNQWAQEVCSASIVYLWVWEGVSCLSNWMGFFLNLRGLVLGPPLIQSPSGIFQDFMPLSNPVYSPDVSKGYSSPLCCHFDSYCTCLKARRHHLVLLPVHFPPLHHLGFYWACTQQRNFPCCFIHSP